MWSSSSRALLWINLSFLLVISSLPFFVGLVGTYSNTHIACVLYGAVSFVAMAILAPLSASGSLRA